jgi:hypothetical protein
MDRIASKKRVAGQRFASLDRFQQEGMLGAAGNAKKCADRGEKIGADLATERDQVAPVGEIGKLTGAEIVPRPFHLSSLGG